MAGGRGGCANCGANPLFLFLKVSTITAVRFGAARFDAVGVRRIRLRAAVTSQRAPSEKETDYARDVLLVVVDSHRPAGWTDRVLPLVEEAGRLSDSTADADVSDGWRFRVADGSLGRRPEA